MADYVNEDKEQDLVDDIEEIEETAEEPAEGPPTKESEEETPEVSDHSKWKRDRKPKKDKKTQQLEELNDRYMRTMAEFDNFRKRSEKEKSQMFEIGAKDMVERILPVIDNFERGLSTVPEEADSGFIDGMRKVYKQLLTTLEEAGVKPIEAVGNEFDPNLHNAVMHMEDESQGTNMVIEELLKGYMYRESVVRHSMVKVVN